MKKLFLMAVAAVAMLATSCSKDDTNAVAGGEKSTVTFAVEAPVMATRADLGKAENVDQLYYAVYSEDGKTHYPELSGVKNNAFSNLKATVEIELVNGKAYTVVFWAQNSLAPYTFDGTNAKVTVNYDDEFIGNQDSYDAFYKTHSVATVNGARTEKEIILTRPFAQLNIATADYETAINGGFTLQEVQVEVPAYSTLNFLKLDENGNATVENVENVETTRVFNFADIFTTEQITVGSKDYKLLSMNYILINTKELETVKFIAKQEGNLTQTYTYNNVPLQRNYKTNIIGNLLTSTLDFEVTIDPIFEKEVDTYVTDADALINAVAGVADGDTITVAAGTYPVVLDITGAKNFTLKAAKDAVVTIAGVDHQTNGTPSTVTFEGITIDNSIVATRAEGGWFTGTAQNIAPCVGAWGGDLTFNNCKFIVAGTSGRETGVMTWWTTNLATFKFNSCVFEGKDSQSRAMQIYGNVNMEVNNCTFTTAKDYTLKYVAGEGNVAVFEGNTVSNSENFVELGSAPYAGNKYTVKINNNTLNSVNPYVVANPENQVIYVNNEIVEIATKDSDVDVVLDAIYEIENGESYDYVVEEDIDTTDTNNPYLQLNGGELNIDGQDHTITSGTDKDYGVIAHNGSTMVIDNANIVSMGGGIGATSGAHIVFNGNSLAVNTANTSARYNFYAAGEGSTITINGGEFSFSGTTLKRAYVYAAAGTFVYINGGTFGKASTRSGYTAGILGEGTVVIKGGTFGFNPSAWVAEGYSAIKKDGNWVVVYGTYADDAVVENVANAEELANALTSGATVINVAAGEYTMPAADKFTNETVLNCAPGTVFEKLSKLDINGATVVGATFSNPNGTAVDQTINGTFKGCTFDGSNALRWTYAGETVVFEDCVFSGNVYGIHFDGGKNDVIFRNCTISGFNGLGSDLTMVTFEGCTFVGNGRSGYNGANLWGSAKMINCEFTFDGSTSNEWIDCIGADKTYEFENCTVNGVAYTKDNYTEYGDIFSRNHVKVMINGVECQM